MGSLLCSDLSAGAETEGEGSGQTGERPRTFWSHSILTCWVTWSSGLGPDSLPSHREGESVELMPWLPGHRPQVLPRVEPGVHTSFPLHTHSAVRDELRRAERSCPPRRQESGAAPPSEGLWMPANGSSCCPWRFPSSSVILGMIPLFRKHSRNYTVCPAVILELPLTIWA